MLVPGPQRYDESIAFVPLERLAVDHRRAAAAERMINARAGVAMAVGFFAGAQHLDSARHRWQGCAARGRIYELKRRAVEGIA